MRVIAVVVCSLSLFLWACGEPQILYSEPVAEQNSSAEALVPRLLHVCLRIGEGFSVPEQDRILAAVASENLRSPVQFDFAPETTDTPRPGSWTLLKVAGPARVTERFPQGGGAIALDVSRLTAGDLRKAITEAGGLTAGATRGCTSTDALAHGGGDSPTRRGL